MVSYFNISSMPSKSYMIIGLAGAIFGYITREKRKEFIGWDNNKILLKDQINGEVVYNCHDVDDIIFSYEHVTIKSGVANGIIFELNDYRDKDVEQMRSELNNIKLSHLNSK